jgi:sugar lactone lactonase YvrE
MVCRLLERMAGCGKNCERGNVRAGGWTSLAAALLLSLFCAVAGAQGKQAIVVSQTTFLAPITGGGFLSGGNPSGGSFAVNPNGDIVVSNTYGSTIYLINGRTKAVTTLSSSFSNPGGVAVDSKGNLYISHLYNGIIYKFPYVNGAYVPVADPTSTYPGYCSGADTVQCQFAHPPSGNVRAMAFDSQDNFYMVSSLSGSNGGTSIYEAPSTVVSPSGTATLVYTDSANVIGSVAVDPWGDLFFTDAVFANAGNESSSSSGLYELKYTAGTGFSGTPITLETYTDSTPLGNYNDTLGAVAVDSNGTVYFATQYNGMFALPNSLGTVSTSSIYGVSTQGAKAMELDQQGNIYVVAYNTSGDAVGRILLNNIPVGSTTIGGTAATATATVMVNDGTCTSAPVLTFTANENGATSTEFTGATTGTCASQSLYSSNGSYSATFTFNPAKVGQRFAMMTVKDTVNAGSSSLLTVSGTGNGPLVTLDPGSGTAYATGFTAPQAVAVDGSGNTFVADPSAGKVFEIPAGSANTVTPTTIGSGFTAPSGLAFDAAGDLFVADKTANSVSEIPNVSGALVPASKTTVLASTTLIGSSGLALTAPSGLAFGPDGTLYIADTGNNRVAMYRNGATGLRASGLSLPAGVAVDAAGNVYIANTGAGNVVVYQGDVYSTLTTAAVTAPSGIAVDPSGSLLLGDKTSGKIVRVPSEAGVLTTADAVTVESFTSAYGLSLDSAGNLYVADASGKAVDAVQRISASVNFGNVTDGTASSVVTIYAENAGNTALTEGTPAFTTPGNTQFSLMAGSTNGCASGGTIATGRLCQLAGQFLPNSTASGALSTTATFNSNAANASSATVKLAGTAVPTALMSQTITFAPVTTPIVYGQVATETLSATGGGSGNPVTFSVVSGPGTVSGTNGSTLTITGAGSIIVAANQAGSSTYSPAPQVTQTIVVNQASQTITFTPLTTPISYTATPITLSATGGASGNAVTFSVLSGPGTVSGNQLTVTGVGTIVVAADQAGNTNYTAAKEVTQSVVVNQASQTITFAQPTSPVTYPTAVTLTASSTSGLTVTFKVISGPGTLATSGGVTTLTPTGVGSIVVAADQAGTANYAAAAEVQRTVVVNAIGQVAPVTFVDANGNPVAAGTYNVGHSPTVFLMDATPGATIYFTLDGSVPTVNSTPYSGNVAKNGIPVSVTQTISAIAVLTGYTNSPVVSEAFVIDTGAENLTVTLSASSLTLKTGQTGTITITVTPQQGIVAPLTFGCSGLPTGGSCTFNPNPTSTSPAQTAVSSVMTVTAPTTLSELRGYGRSLMPGVTLALMFCVVGLRKRRRFAMALMVAMGMVGLTMMSGCGSSGPGAQTSTVTISVAGDSVRVSPTFTLTVTP